MDVEAPIFGIFSARVSAFRLEEPAQEYEHR